MPTERRGEDRLGTRNLTEESGKGRVLGILCKMKDMNVLL